jgi:uncharacterized protein YgbK (DUF1537 family)
MSRHPVTPMGEADLRQHLAAQGIALIGLVDVRALDGNDDALAAQVTPMTEAAAGAVLFDALHAEHLERIGAVIARQAAAAPLLALGASSVAQALLAHWQAREALPTTARSMTIAPAEAPVFVLAGSQSPVTALQIEHAAAHFQVVALDVVTMLQDAAAVETRAGEVARLLGAGRHVLAHTGQARADGGPSPQAVAELGGRFLRRVLDLAPQVRRVGIAGGDTSSLAAGALGLWGFEWLGAFGPGVSLLRARADEARFDRLELLLKGGQMGAPDLFGRLVYGT